MTPPETDKVGRLLSHRLRGFDEWDSTQLGLQRALEAGVRNAEFDVRFTRDGQAVAYHDPLFRANDGAWHFVDEWELAALRTQAAFPHLATLEEMCACFAEFRSADALLHVDIKVGGQETVIHDTIAGFGLLPHVVIVSWLPGALVRFNALAPETRLCFSHLPLAPVLYGVAKAVFEIVDHVPRVVSRAMREFGPSFLKEASTFSFYFHDNGDPVTGDTGDDGAHHNLCHVVPGLMSGAMLDLLRRTRGMVCMPVRLAPRTLVTGYREQDVQVAVYSVDDEASLEHLMATVDPDFVYVDSADVLRRSMAVETAGGRLRHASM